MDRTIIMIQKSAWKAPYSPHSPTLSPKEKGSLAKHSLELNWPHPPAPSPTERGRRQIEQYYNDTKKAPGRRCIHNLGWSEAKPQVFACVEPFRGTALHRAKKSRRRSTLPRSHPRSTIDAKELNFRVRDGIGCGLFANITGKIKES